MEHSLSIIVPIYNAEEYLDKCLNSLINQTYGNYDIIAVNDGSSDRSGEIIQQLSTSVSNLKVYNKSNSGLSDTRNFGVKKSKSDFVMFVDSDDYIQEDSIARQMNIINSTGCDALIKNFQNVDSNEQSIHVKSIRNFVYDEALVSSKIALELLLTQKMPHFAWIGIFRRSMFSNEIKFPVGRRFEDSAIMYKLIGESKTVYFDNKKTYFYRQNSSSIMHNVKVKDAEDIVKNTMELEKYINVKYADLKEYANVYILSRLLNALIISYKTKDRSARVSGMNRNLRKSILQLNNKIKDSRLLFSGQKIRIFLLRLNLLKIIYAH